jgi:hypothetical protein
MYEGNLVSCERIHVSLSECDYMNLIELIDDVTFANNHIQLSSHRCMETSDSLSPYFKKKTRSKSYEEKGPIESLGVYDPDY